MSIKYLIEEKISEQLTSTWFEDTIEEAIKGIDFKQKIRDAIEDNISLLEDIIDEQLDDCINNQVEDAITNIDLTDFI